VAEPGFSVSKSLTAVRPPERLPVIALETAMLEPIETIGDQVSPTLGSARSKSASQRARPRPATRRALQPSPTRGLTDLAGGLRHHVGVREAGGRPRFTVDAQIPPTPERNPGEPDRPCLDAQYALANLKPVRAPADRC